MKQTNLSLLDKPWETTEPITNLWTRINKAKKFVTKTEEDLPESMLIRKIKQILTATGVFEADLRDWEKERTQTSEHMMEFFTKANKYHLEVTTSATAGYANLAKKPPPEDKKLDWKYCWTHGLQLTHSGKDCNDPADGHIANAILGNMKGGCNLIRR